jgi:hypothetical protein
MHHQALSKGSTFLLSNILVKKRIAGDQTIVDKGWTREFTRQIIVVEIQRSCRIQNDKQALKLMKTDRNRHDKQPNNTRLTQISKGFNLTWNCSR